MRVTINDLKRHWREILLVALYTVPTLALMVLGGLWLWETGYAIHFVGATLVAAVTTLAVRALWSPPPHGVTMPALPGASETERHARTALQALIDAAKPDDTATAAAAQALATRAVLVVADAYHPGDKAAWLNVTVPELLLMTEDVARRLRQDLNRELPVFRHVHVSTLLRGRALVDKISKMANVVRLARWLNPKTAVMHEVKAVLTEKLTDGLTGAAKSKVAALIVREVGEAAIKLYSGAYRKTDAEIAARTVTTVGVRPPPPRPLTILIAGQRNAGKSSVLNALAGNVCVPVGRTLPTQEFYRVEIEHAEAGKLILVDSPGVGTEPTKAWIETARETDLVLWTAAANRADRAADQKTLRALRDIAKGDTRLGEIPLVLVATHADRLNPPMEWRPPYDPASGNRPKEQSMRDALAAISGALSIPAERSAIVSVEEVGEGAWNVEALWARIHEALPDAKRKQLERGLREDGWLKAAVDVVRSVPESANKAVEFITR